MKYYDVTVKLISPYDDNNTMDVIYHDVPEKQLQACMEKDLFEEYFVSLYVEGMYSIEDDDNVSVDSQV